MVNIQFVNFTSLLTYGIEHFLLCLLFALFFNYYFSGILLLKYDIYLICVLSLVVFDIFNPSVMILYFLPQIQNLFPPAFPGSLLSLLPSFCQTLNMWGLFNPLSHQIVGFVLEQIAGDDNLTDFQSLRIPQRSYRAWAPLHFPVEETDPVRCHACDFLHSGRQKLDPGLVSHDSFHLPANWCWARPLSL